MKVRIISALLLLPLFLFVIIYGGTVTKLAVFIISIISIYEFTNAFKISGIKQTNVMLYILTALLMLPDWTNNLYIMPVLLFILVLGESILLIFSKRTIEEIAVSILTYVYICVALNSIIIIRESSLDFVWYIFIFAWATDTCAYFTGLSIGRRKLIPSVSPKKTIEGAIGGIVGCTAVSMIYAYYAHPEYLILVPFVSIIGSIVSQTGDLFASAFKRKLGIKDYGNLIPGHGGMLDRIDSIIFTAPYTFIFIFLTKFI